MAHGAQDTYCLHLSWAVGQQREEGRGNEDEVTILDSVVFGALVRAHYWILAPWFTTS